MERPSFNKFRSSLIAAFTLIEMSIVLVIIGLVVGGILVGQDLINGAQARAQITQIERYRSAVRTFQTKYNNFLPGDIPDPYATMFGFQARGTPPGQGNGDGIMTGYGGPSGQGSIQGGGETAMFWVDLSAAGLIDGGFSTASATSLGSSDVTGSSIGLYLPQAKIGGGNYVYVWSAACFRPGDMLCTTYFDANYFGVSSITLIANASSAGQVISTTNITVSQAYNIDKKWMTACPFQVQFRQKD